MQAEPLFDGRNYISAADAAQEAGCTRDYISLLCRQGKVRARRLGRNWYVDSAGFRSFLVSKEYRMSKHRKELSGVRTREYKNGGISGDRREGIHESLKRALAGQMPRAAKAVSALTTAPAGAAEAVLRTAGQSLAHIPLYTVTPGGEFLQKVTALTFSLLVVFGVYAVIQPEFTSYAIKSATEVVSERLFEPIDTALSMVHGEILSAESSISSAALPPFALDFDSMLHATAELLRNVAEALESLYGDVGDSEVSTGGAVFISIEPYRTQ